MNLAECCFHMLWCIELSNEMLPNTLLRDTGPTYTETKSQLGSSFISCAPSFWPCGRAVRVSCAIRRMLVGAIRTTGSDDRKELLLQFPCPSCLYMNKTFAKFEFASNATVSNFCSRPLVGSKSVAQLQGISAHLPIVVSHVRN